MAQATADRAAASHTRGAIEILGVCASEFRISGGPFGLWNTMNWLNDAAAPYGTDVSGYVASGS